MVLVDSSVVIVGVVTETVVVSIRVVVNSRTKINETTEHSNYFKIDKTSSGSADSSCQGLAIVYLAFAI